MSEHAQAFVDVVRAQGWLQPQHEAVLASNPAAPWDALYNSGALGAEHVRWAIQQVNAQLPPPPPPPNTEAPAPVAVAAAPGAAPAPSPAAIVAPAPAFTPAPAPAPTPAAAPPQAVSPPAPAPASAWEAAVTKHESGEFMPPPMGAPETPTVSAPEASAASSEARKGEMQALSLDDFDEKPGELPSLSSADLDSGGPSTDAPTVGLSDEAKAVVSLIVDNGMGTRDFLEQKFAHKQAVEVALQKELSSAQFLVESLAIAVDEMQDLARLTGSPLLAIDPSSGAARTMDDPIIEAKVQSQDIDPAIVKKALNAQAALKLLNIDRHETGLIRHFLAQDKAGKGASKRRSTTSPQIKRSKTVVHAEDKNSGLMPVILVTAVVLALVSIPFLKRLKTPDDDLEVASSKKEFKRSIEFTKLGDEKKTKAPRDTVPDDGPIAEEKPDSDTPVSQDQPDETDVKTFGEKQALAAKKMRGVKLKEAEGLVLKALEAHKKEESAGAIALADQAMKSYQSLSLEKRAKQCERLKEDFENYQKLQSEVFPKSVKESKQEALSLSQFKGMSLKLMEAIPGGARAKLSVGGSTDLLWKTMPRGDVYTVLSAAKKAPRPLRMSLATLALLENEEVAHSLFRTLWNDLPGHREEISSRLALMLQPGKDGFRIQKGHFVAAGELSGSASPLLVADKGSAPKTGANASGKEPVKADPEAPYKDMLAAIKAGKSGLNRQWGSFRRKHWDALDEKKQDNIRGALKKGHGRNLKDLDKVMQKASRVKVGSKARSRLKELRDFALAGIYDKVLYPDANHGRAGQPEIDKRVDALRTLWEQGMARLRGVPRARTLQSNLARSRKMLIDAGLSADDPLFLTSFQSITENYRFCTGISALDGKLQRRDGLHYDMQVLAYNKALKGVPADCRRQVRILNEYRMMQGRHCLAINLNLAAAAKKHCAWMQESGTFSHTSTLPGLKTPRQRAKAAGYKSPFVGENIAKGQPSPLTVHKAWYNSAPHHRNMLEKVYYEIGVGHVGQHWTQLFGGGRPSLR